MTQPSLDICVCTFRRPHLRETINSLFEMQHPPDVRLRILVIDNDDTDSARGLVSQIGTGAPIPVSYHHSPGRNISIARNTALDASDADYLAFIDDDELADTNWLSELWATLQSQNVDVAFGRIEGVFPPETPEWMRQLNIHTPGPQRRNGKVETGGAGTVLMRWHGTPWFEERFDLSRGKSGGEDTEFFYRLGRMGADFEIADGSLVIEPVDPARLSMKWLIRRRFRSGQSYVASTPAVLGRVALIARASAKSVFSFLVAIPHLWSPHKWRFWFLRGVYHAGVVAGCLNLKQAEFYGHTS